MATLEVGARNAACNAIVDLVDAGAGAGTLVFETSGDVEVATLTFSDPAFGGSASGVATASAITSDSSATGGTVAQASIFDSNALKVLEATVSTAAADINLSSLTIGAGDTVSISSLTATMPAS
tara:strand:+ start:5757 stop:6128 length:372 start_codon:yes stop_codon:yes gene_type:complete